MNRATFEEVSSFAALVDQYGALIVIGVVLGLFFILVASVTLRRFFKSLEHADRLREARDAALDAERQRLLGQVLSLTTGSTDTMRAVGESIREVTKEIVEFRRDNRRAFNEIGTAFKELSMLTEQRRGETTEQFNRLHLQNEEIVERITFLESRRRDDRGKLKAEGEKP